MTRKAIAIAAVLTLVAAFLVAAWLFLPGWTGDSQDRQLVAGQTVTLDSGLTLTVPAGWRGSYTRYYWFPGWLHIGDRAGGLDRSDYLQLLREDSSPGIIAMTFYDDAVVRAVDRPVLARAGEIAVYAAQPPTVPSILITTHRAGGRRGRLYLQASEDTTASVKREWTRLRIRGATLPF